MQKSTTLIVFLLIVGAGCVLLYGTLTQGHGWGDDFAAYLMQAKSLAEGTHLGFSEANEFTIVNSSRVIGPVTYPWGYPMLLAPIYAAFGMNLLALKAVGAISYALFLGLLWFSFRRAHSPLVFLCLALLFALHPGLLGFSNSLLSDLPFLLLSTLGIFLIGALVVDRRRLFSSLLDSVLLGAVIAAAYAVRTSGALLLVTLAFSQVISCLTRHRASDQREPKIGEATESMPAGTFLTKLPFISMVPYAVFALLLAICEFVLPSGGGSYASSMETISIATLQNNLRFYLLEPDIPNELFSGAPYSYFLYMASIPLALAGAIRRIRSDYPAVAYIAFTLCLYALWPFTQGLRFLFPILPFYLSFVLSGLEALQINGKSIIARLVTLAVYAPVVLLIFYFGFISTGRVRENIRDSGEISAGPFASASREMFSFISEKTPESSTIIFFKPRAMRLMTNRKSIMINKADQLSRGDYLCLYKGADGYNQVAFSLVQELERKGSARLLYDRGSFRVYSLKGSDS